MEKKSDTNTPASVKPQDKSLPEFQTKLLDMAFETAALIPAEPFIKDRSRAQEAVVNVCLELDQPIRAAQYADQIQDWRKGLCYANTAYYLAQKGYGIEHIQKGLELAEKIAAMDHGQQWRNEAIKVRIAQARTLLEQSEKAGASVKDAANSQAGKQLETKAMPGDEKSYEQQIKALDDLVAMQGFETTKDALFGYSQLFDRHYEDAAKRAQLEEKIKSSWTKTPLPIRVDLLMLLSVSAMEHKDTGKSLSLLDETETFLNDYQWPLENRISIAAKLAKLRFRAGDREKAKTQSDAALAQFDNEGNQIVDIYRAGALRLLAEAYQAMGETGLSLAVYKKAVEQGVVNPNSRPRAEDLSATCSSMALSAVEPDQGLWTRLDQIRNGLGSPW